MEQSKDIADHRPALRLRDPNHQMGLPAGTLSVRQLQWTPETRCDRCGEAIFEHSGEVQVLDEDGQPLAD